MADRPADSTFLKSKQHFEILDGLRGLAAAVVVIFHFMKMSSPILVIISFHMVI